MTRTTRKIRAWPLLALLALCPFAPAQAARRAGPPRALRLEWPQTAATDASQQQPVVWRDEKTAQWQLFFTQVASGTRNLWRATASTPDGDAAGNGEANGSATEWKSLRWRAESVTRFLAPSWADSAVPVAGGAGVLCVTNAAPDSAPSTLARHGSRIAYVDIATGRSWPLTTGARDSEPALSPEGRQLAFVSDRSGLESIFIQPLEALPPQESARRDSRSPRSVARRVVTMARHPVWLDESTLLFESTRPGQSGLYRLHLPRGGEGRARAQLLLSGSVRGEFSDIALSAGRRAIAVVARSAADGASQIYLLSADGSGIRAVPGTQGAAHPAFAPDNSALFFDKPLSAESAGAAKNGVKRALWMVPLSAAPPLARLEEVRPTGGAVGAVSGETTEIAPVAIVGTVLSEEGEPLQARLEWGRGAAPEQWHSVTAVQTPLQHSVLVVWKPPAPAGRWTLRLTATDSDGEETVSTLSFATPLGDLGNDGSRSVTTAAAPASSSSLSAHGLPAPASSTVDALKVAAPTHAGPLPFVVANAAPNVAPDVAPPNAVPAPDIALPNAALPNAALPDEGANAVAASGKTLAAKSIAAPPTRDSPAGGPLPFLPLPALPPAPDAPGEPALAAPNAPASPAPASPASPAPPAPLPSRVVPFSPKELPPASVTLPSTPQSRTAPEAKPEAKPEVGRDDGTSTDQPYAARLTVTGLPATLNAGQSTPVQIALRNLGRSGWFQQGARPVRLFYRWTDTTTGFRARWAYRWLPADIAPGGANRLSLDLAAPRAGNFRLDIGLLPMSGGRFSPPPATARVDEWPGEFGVVSFDVNVR